MRWLWLVFSPWLWASELVLEQGQSRLIDREGVTELLVADGAIAQVSPINDQVALIVAKQVGRTELYFIQGEQISPAAVQVVESGTRLGGLQLRLMILEQASEQANSDGLDWGIQVNGQSDNDRARIGVSSLLSWLPSARQNGLKVVAQPQLRMQPRRPVALKVGGELERQGAEGATEDKSYGLEIDANYHWVADQIEVELQVTLRTPTQTEGFRRQSLIQQTRVELSEVTEFARFDGVDASRASGRRGLPFSSQSNRKVHTHWRVVGWFEPLPEDL